MYPCGTDLYGMNLIQITYVNGHFDYQIIRNSMEFFVDADHACAVADHRSISCILLNFLVFTIHCKFYKHPCIATHSTDSKVCAFYITTKMA